MVQEPNLYDATLEQTDSPNHPSRLMHTLTYLAIGFVGLIIGSYMSVHVGSFWYPAEATGDILSKTIAAVIFGPIAMTLGILPSLGFYFGPFHGLLMLLGMALTVCSTWMHFHSRNFYYAWLVFVGMILWSHNNYLAFNALMSV